MLAVYVFVGLLLGLSGQARAGEAPSVTGQATVPRRVVSLAPSVTETLFALGVGDRLVGVTTHCDYPAEARRLPKIGDFVNPSLEAIVAKRPDLVIGVTGATDPVKAREMKRLGLKVVLVSVSNLGDVLNSIRSIAQLLRNENAGEKLVAKITTQVQEVKKRVSPAARRSVLLVVGFHPLIAVGGKNFIDELITLAAGENIAGSAAQPWLNLPDEVVVAKAPQVIIEAGMGSEREESVKRWGDLRSVPAVREGRIYSYPSDKILRPGPRFGEALADIARLIHPECFVKRASRNNDGSRCESPKP
ncbi:MAG: ABC transporter substrate-binding protein [Deltaproteobacteria bacterium]|nr:ABC transporter substrate-binding protein [Deltaproteobacteria bacterium]